MTPAASTTDELCEAAIDLARGAAGDAPSPEDAAEQLANQAGDDRAALEAARDRLVARLRADQADFDATGGLALLNRALATYGWSEPFDWKQRWAQHRKP
ncbi:MAG: hypothetical protein ACR2KC_05910 [Acidimicrobiales bacterium]